MEDDLENEISPWTLTMKFFVDLKFYLVWGHWRQNLMDWQELVLILEFVTKLG